MCKAWTNRPTKPLDNVGENLGKQKWDRKGEKLKGEIGDLFFLTHFFV